MKFDLFDRLRIIVDKCLFYVLRASPFTWWCRCKWPLSRSAFKSEMNFHTTYFFLFKKRAQRTWKIPHIPIFRRLSRADWDKNLKKFEDRCVGFSGLYFWVQNLEIRCRKPFEYCIEIKSGSASIWDDPFKK